MAYFIFIKNLDNLEGSLYRIAENLSDLNNLNINKEDYKIIEDIQGNFNLVKLNKKNVIKYSGDTITYEDNNFLIKNKANIEIEINNDKQLIRQFLENNPNHLLFNRWNSYYNQLNNVNVDSITYPLNKTLQEYFNDLGQPSFHILQLP
jgi:hypothetical protein